MKKIISTLVLAVLAVTGIQAQRFKSIASGSLALEVYNADENSFGVASVIVSGKTDAFLIDAQFTLPDAEKVAQKIKASGKNLKGIYVSHGDPDYYFGLEVFKKYFPGVVAYASPATVEHIKKTEQNKLEVWGGKFGKSVPSNVVLPQVLKGNSFELEGQKLEIIGLEKFPERTFVWIPSIKAVAGGINVFGNDFHLWWADTQTPQSRQEWVTVLDNIIALQPAIVIPAHGGKNAAFDLASVKHTKEYLLFAEDALKKNKTSEALVNAIKAKYPGLSFEGALQLSAKVNTGELHWE